MKLYLIKKINKRELYNRPVYNNEYIKTKIWAFHENIHGNKNLTKDKYNDHSILLIKSIFEAENNHYFFEKHNSVPSLFNELVQIIDYFDDESNN